MLFILDCEKNAHNGLWSFDYDFEDDLKVKNEPLMNQASALIDSILLTRDKKICKKIEIGFDSYQLKGADIILDYLRPEYGGSIYKSSKILDWKTNYEKEIWLCPVLTYFFKEPPIQLWAYICNMG